MAKKKKKGKKAKKGGKKESSKKKGKKGSKKNTAKTLSSMQKGWKKAKPRHIGAPVPDDSYPARIESAVIEESKSSGRLQVHWALDIADGDYAGRKVHKFSGMESEDNLSFLQGDIEILELAIPEDIGDLGETLEEALGILLEINVRTRDEFTNIDFIELLEDEEESDEDEDEDEEDEDEEEDDEDEDEEDEDEDEEDEEEEDEDEEFLTKAMVRKMDMKELKAAIKDYGLKTKPKKYKTVTSLRKAVTAEL